MGGDTDFGRPNILFLCTDQQRFDALGCYGNPRIRTPNIDRLAADGVLFERCYTPNPVCAPARASILTGRYPHAHGLWANGVALPAHEQLVSKVLAGAGYDCGLIGKLHFASCFAGRTEPRLDDGFRIFEWSHDPPHGSPESAYHRWLQRRFPALWQEASERQRTFDSMPVEAHYTRWVSDTTIEFLQERRDPEKPFFLWANFYDPHNPFVAPPECLERYDAASLPEPARRPGELDSKPAIQREASHAPTTERARGYNAYDEADIQRIIHAYYAMVSFVDDEVGRILDTLDQLGLAGSTLVVFSSDHGEMLGDHHLLLKGPFFYEGAVRVPLIFRWSGRLPAGERRQELVQLTDLAPTFIEAAGLPGLPRCQGQSLLSLARGEDGSWSRGWALCEYRNSGRPYEPPVHATMLRSAHHKVVVYHGAPASERVAEGELYDLEADPGELNNLWESPDHSHLRTKLERMLLDVLVATEDRTQPREAVW